MKRLFALLAALAATAAVAVPVSLAASDSNGTASLVHVGLNPPECGGPFTNTGTTPTDSGVVNVHYNVVQDRFMVNLSVHDALPNQIYVLDVRCWTFGPQSEIGTLTTNSQGTGTAQIKLNGATPLNPFYIDISVKGGAGGVGGYGDTFIAGPVNLG